MAIITLHRTDLGVSTVDITAFEFERCTDIIEHELTAAEIDFQTVSYTPDRWNLRIEDYADVDAAKSIIDSAIEGAFGQWTDAACIDAAVEFYKATRGKSGKTWWGEGFAGIDDGVMADAGWLVLQDKKAAAGEILDAATSSLDEDVADVDLIGIAEAAFGLRPRPDGTWASERFNALPTDALILAARLLRCGDVEEANNVLIDNDEEDDDEMDDDEAIAYAVEAADRASRAPSVAQGQRVTRVRVADGTLSVVGGRVVETRHGGGPAPVVIAEGDEDRELRTVVMPMRRK